jgi:hypothetical protein
MSDAINPRLNLPAPQPLRVLPTSSNVSHHFVLLRQNVSFLARDPRHGSGLVLLRDIGAGGSLLIVAHSESHGLQASVLQPVDTTLMFEDLQMARFADFDFDVLDSPEQVGGELAQAEYQHSVGDYVQVADGSSLLGNQSR